MGRFLFIFCVLSLAGFSAAIQCYECAGYDPTLPVSYLNNKACSDGHFDSNKVSKVGVSNSNYQGSCYKDEFYKIDDYEYTVRGLNSYKGKNGVVDFATINSTLNNLAGKKEGEQLPGEEGVSALDRLIEMFEATGKAEIAGKAGIAGKNRDRSTKQDIYPYNSNCYENLCNGSSQTLMSPFLLLIFLFSFAVTF